MTPLDQFRSNPTFVGEMNRLIKGDGNGPTVLAQAIVAVQNNLPATDVEDGESELASVRRLSRIAERQTVIAELLSLSEPPDKEELVDPEPTWGANLSELVKP